MTNYYSTRYFQLTPEILIEYRYTDLNITVEQDGDVSDYIVDLGNNPASIINSSYDASNNFVLNSSLSSFVLPTNRSESKFIQCSYGSGTSTKYIWNILSSNMSSKSLNTLTENDKDIIFDNFRVHFTSRNAFGDYDGIILKGIIYDINKNKICLLSHCIKKADDMVINHNPMLINQKLYTTYIDLKLPSVGALLNMNTFGGESNLLNNILLGYEIMDNTPLVMSVYGIKSISDYNNFEYYNTERLNSISIPSKDSYNNLSIEVKEADDGDYFEIYPVVDDSSTSFSDYIYKISNERPDTIIVLHELSLTEYYTDSLNQVRSETTHREHYIVNAGQANDGTEINEDDLDKIMTYRPIVSHSGKIVSFIIEDQMKIVNTLDNTTIVKMGTLKYGYDNGKNPSKYGKRMNKIYLGEIPAQVNVYNKKPDIDTDNIKITNSGANVKIENHQHSIVGFIECANVGVSIEQIPTTSFDR